VHALWLRGGNNSHWVWKQVEGSIVIVKWKNRVNIKTKGRVILKIKKIIKKVIVRLIDLYNRLVSLD
jgi:hypothetical protein